MKEPFSTREKVGVTTAIVAGLALVAYGSIGLFNGAADRPKQQSELPQYRPDCVLDIGHMENATSWQSVLEVGKGMGLTPAHITAEELVAFNGLPSGTPIEGQDYADMCVDGREHGYVGFYSDDNPKTEQLEDYFLTPVATPNYQFGSLQRTATVGPSLTPTEVLSTVTPVPTDIVVHDTSLQVTQQQRPSDYDCQYDSTYRLRISVSQPLSNSTISTSMSCSATHVEGNYFVTNAHCVSSVPDVYKQRYDVIDQETNRSYLTYELQHLNGERIDVVGGVYSESDDIAVLYANPYHMRSEKEACMNLGDESDAERLNGVQLMNYENGATSPVVFRARLLGPDPGNENQYLLADGVDPAVPSDHTSRQGTLWNGGSGGSVVDLNGGDYIGTTSAVMYRGEYYSKVAEEYDIAPYAFVRLGIMRPVSKIIDLIRQPYPEGVPVEEIR